MGSYTEEAGSRPRSSPSPPISAALHPCACGTGTAAQVTSTEALDGEIRVILFGKSLDLGSFAQVHPGGSKVLRMYHERDASEIFAAYHSESAQKMMQAMAKQAPPAPSSVPQVSMSEIARDFQNLTTKLEELGYFKPDLVDEVVKLCMCLVPYCMSFPLLRLHMPFYACLCFGFATYMCGWVSHDYLHHSVFRNVKLNDWVGWTLGWMQGYEELWWKARHNTHHCTTNEDGNDPDIMTAPVLIFVRNNPELARKLNRIQKFQKVYYLPLLALLDIYWRFESLMYLYARLTTRTQASKKSTNGTSKRNCKQLDGRIVRRTCLLVLNYVLVGYAFYNYYGYLFLTSIVRGFLTGVVVFATHYGEDILPPNHSLSLVEQTSRTSRNIEGGYLVNLFTGFIALQTEHHLWPRMPTSRLALARKHCLAFFAKHNLQYKQSSLWGCVWYNLQALETRTPASHQD